MSLLKRLRVARLILWAVADGACPARRQQPRQGRMSARRWHLQHPFVAIPKSLVEERIISSADVATFELSDADTVTLDNLAAA
jgi:diketogulonate reductase-like aldo/keto reductase